MSLKLIKTPLRYPGGKSKASTKMDQYFPDFSKYKEYREPFLGGGSEQSILQRHIQDLRYG